MAAISQTTVWNAFFLIKMYRFQLKFHFKVCSYGSNWQYSSIDSDNGLALTPRIIRIIKIRPLGTNFNETLMKMSSGKWRPFCLSLNVLTHWGQATHICFSKQITIGSDNGLSPVRRQAIIWTNAGILLIGPLGTNFSEISIEIQIFSFMKMHLKMSFGKRRPFCLSLNVLIDCMAGYQYSNPCNGC